MSLTQIGLLFILFANVWALYVMCRTWYGKGTPLVKYWYDENGEIQFGEEENDGIE